MSTITYSPPLLKILALNQAAKNENYKTNVKMLPKTLHTSYNKICEIQRMLCTPCYNELLQKALGNNETIDRCALKNKKRYTPSNQCLDKFIKYLDEEYDEIFIFCLDCIDVWRSKPQQVYAQQISLMMSDTDYWYDFYEHYYGDSPSDIQYWNMKNLKLNQALILKNHPNEAPDFCGEHSQIVEKAYSIKLNGYKYCSSCVGKHMPDDLNIILVTTTISRVSSEQVISDYLWDDRTWCADCKFKPLFDFKDDDEQYRSIDIIYANSYTSKRRRLSILGE
ncbi:OrNV gp074-like protein [Tomelloso virus]|uniref:OrNV gp074-like protein n=1 Tax=Tomelloso virus TaxID=2053981 RepID=A0A2H4T2R2_9VIRU|nr:OrNV gp074-like protein [Tomelloso virus]ATY70225.1 OrNV gp074-like protein [Tomelloso virus]